MCPIDALEPIYQVIFHGVPMDAWVEQMLVEDSCSA
jgi:hypothetical protein